MMTLIAAISKNNCIGRDNELPWNIPEDMERMRKITQNKILIMGRKTWESIPEKRRPLPNRTSVVITRNNDYPLPEGVERYGSVEEALKAHEGEEIFGFDQYKESKSGLYSMTHLSFFAVLKMSAIFIIELFLYLYVFL